MSGQRAIPQRIALVAAQADGLAKIEIRGEHRRRPAPELPDHHRAELVVESAQLRLLTQAFAIRRIADQQAQRQWHVAGPGQFRQRPHTDPHDFLQADPGDVFLSGADDTRVGVITANFRQGAPPAPLGPAPGIRHDGPPLRLVVAPPVLEAESLATQPRGNIRDHHGAFKQQRARAAHRVDQSPAARGDSGPVGAQQDRRRQVFLQRRRSPAQAVAALVQAAPGKIQRQHGLLATQSYINADVRVFAGHRRASPQLVGKPVDDRVLAALGAELGVANLAIFTGKIDGEALLRAEQRRPVHRLQCPVEAVAVCSRQPGNGQQHAIGKPRPQAGAIGQRHRATEVDPRHGFPGRGGAKARQFRRQQRLKALRTGRKPLVLFELTERHGAQYPQ